MIAPLLNIRPGRDQVFDMQTKYEEAHYRWYDAISDTKVGYNSSKIRGQQSLLVVYSKRTAVHVPIIISQEESPRPGACWYFALLITTVPIVLNTTNTHRHQQRTIDL